MNILFLKAKIATPDSETETHTYFFIARVRSIMVSFLARWAKRNLSYSAFAFSFKFY
jgi:hypothetical protein